MGSQVGDGPDLRTPEVSGLKFRVRTEGSVGRTPVPTGTENLGTISIHTVLGGSTPAALRNFLHRNRVHSQKGWGGWAVRV